MAEQTEAFVTYARRPCAGQARSLHAKLFLPKGSPGPLPAMIWVNPTDKPGGKAITGRTRKMAMELARHGYATVLLDTRAGALEADLMEPARALLPELQAEAAAQRWTLPAECTGAAALGAVEDCAAFLHLIGADPARNGLSGHFMLGGSGFGAATVLNTLALAGKLGIDLPPVATAVVLSGGFAWPSLDMPPDTRILALHGSAEKKFPPRSIRSLAYRTGASFVLLESDEHKHGAPQLTGKESFRHAIRRFVRYDMGRTLASSVLRHGEMREAKARNDICITTCVKNEGPFLLEWIAHNRAIGVTDFILFSNDCDDGTAELLERLDEMGVVHHFDNPSNMLGTAQHLGVTVALAPLHRAFRRSDYAIVTDVDEFIQIDTADGTLNGLIAEYGHPDAISLAELLFGFGGVDRFEDRLVTEQFRVSKDLGDSAANARQARRGVKSIMRVMRGVQAYGNHRPTIKHDWLDKVHWLDGAGHRVPRAFVVDGDRGLDVRKRYTDARVNHYTLRSCESMLVKFDRGDAVRPGRMRKEYFKHRNGRDMRNDDFLSRVPAIRAEIDRLLADDTLRALHDQAVARHRARIEALKTDPDHAEIWALIRAELTKPIRQEEQAGPAKAAS